MRVTFELTDAESVRFIEALKGVKGVGATGYPNPSHAGACRACGGSGLKLVDISPGYQRCPECDGKCTVAS